MIKEKYYTPTIEEFHPNFEFEYKTLGDIWEKEKYPFGTVWSSADDVVGGNIRVKHLDREDIEGEGYVHSRAECLYKRQLSKGYLLLLHIPKYNHVTIAYQGGKSFDKHIKFTGTIKNKSELKKILKMISYDHKE